jgi:hypothetical protein
VLDRRNTFRRLLEAVVAKHHTAFLEVGGLEHDAMEVKVWHSEFDLDTV